MKRLLSVLIFILTIPFAAVGIGRRKQRYAQIEFVDEFRDTGVRVAGEPKSGKTYLIGYLSVEDFRRNRPVICVDGKGDLIENFMKQVLADPKRDELIPRVVYVSFRDDCVHCIPFIDYSETDEKGRLYEPANHAQFLLHVIYRITEDYKGKAHRMKQYITTSATLICEAGRLSGVPLQATEIYKFFDNSNPQYHNFRHKVFGATRKYHSDTVMFYEGVWEGLSKTKKYEEISSFLNKLFPFIVDYRLRATVGGGRPTFTFQEIEDKKLAVLFDLSGLTEEGKELVASLIISKIDRQIFKWNGRKTPLSVVIDELKSLLSYEYIQQDIEKFHSQGRSYNLWVTLAHQNMHQVEVGVREALWSIDTQFVMRQNNYDDALESVRNLLQIAPEAYKVIGDEEREFAIPVSEQERQELEVLQNAPQRLGIFKRPVKLRNHLLFGSEESKRRGEWAQVPIIPIEGVSKEDVEWLKQYSLRRWGRHIDDVLEEIDERIPQFMNVKFDKPKRETV